MAAIIPGTMARCNTSCVPVSFASGDFRLLSPRADGRGLPGFLLISVDTLHLAPPASANSLMYVSQWAHRVSLIRNPHDYGGFLSLADNLFRLSAGVYQRFFYKDMCPGIQTICDLLEMIAVRRADNHCIGPLDLEHLPMVRIGSGTLEQLRIFRPRRAEVIVTGQVLVLPPPLLAPTVVATLETPVGMGSVREAVLDWPNDSPLTFSAVT